MIQDLFNPTVIIALITALGGGTVLQQLINRKQLAQKSDAEIGLTAVAASKEVVAMLHEDNQKLRAEVGELDTKLDEVLKEFRALRDWKWDASRWMRAAWNDIQAHDPNYPAPPLT